MSKTIVLSSVSSLCAAARAGGEAGAITKVVRVHTPLPEVSRGWLRRLALDVRADDQVESHRPQGKASRCRALETTIRELDSNSADRGSKNVE